MNGTYKAVEVPAPGVGSIRRTAYDSSQLNVVFGMKVLIIGATGLVGRNALAQALAQPAVTEVIAPTRKPLTKQDKLMNPVAFANSLTLGAGGLRWTLKRRVGHCRKRLE